MSCFALVQNHFISFANHFFFLFQDMFEAYLKSFYIRSSDPTHIKLLKVSDNISFNAGMQCNMTIW